MITNNKGRGELITLLYIALVRKERIYLKV